MALVADANRELGVADQARRRLKQMLAVFVALLVAAVVTSYAHLRTAYSEIYDFFAKRGGGGVLCGLDMVQLTPTKIAVSVQWPLLARWMPDPMSPAEALFLLFVVREQKCRSLRALCGPLLAFEGDPRVGTGPGAARLIPWAEFEQELCKLCPRSGTCVDVANPDPNPNPKASQKYADWLAGMIQRYPGSAGLMLGKTPLIALDACITQDYVPGNLYEQGGCSKMQGSALALPMLMQYGFGGFARAFMGTDERTPYQAWVYCFSHRPVFCTPPPPSSRTSGIFSGVMNGGFFGQFLGDALGAVADVVAPEVAVPLQVAGVAAGAVYGGVAANQGAEAAAKGMCEEDGNYGPSESGGACSVQ